MPEGVEILITSLYLNSKFKNKYITDITVLSGRYLKTPIKGLDKFIKKLPLKIRKINSKGKFMWFDVYDKTNTYYIMNTFGLTGKWVGGKTTLDNHDSSRIMIRIMITMEKNDKIYQLYYSDPRNFGTLEISNSINKLDKKLNSLGPDFLKTSFTNKEFYQRIYKYIHTNTGKISKKREDKEVVKVLMDQKLGSG